MELQERLAGLADLSHFLDEYLAQPDNPLTDTTRSMDQAVSKAEEENSWFTRPNLIFALSEISRVLKKPYLERWISEYDSKDLAPSRLAKVGVVMAGNLPLVGMHDFMAVLVSGHIFKGKLSSRDTKLLPYLSEQLIRMNPGFEDLIQFTEESIGDCDAIIATGSNNTYRYFDYYFSHRPHIFRKNRNGIAVLSGQESPADLERLSDDLFMYFGLGCRSVSKIFVPEGYNFDKFFGAIEKYRHLEDHNKYKNNYDYQRSIHLLNKIPHLDNGFLIVKEEQSEASPIATLHYESYASRDELSLKISPDDDSIQCVVSHQALHVPVLDPGSSQKPDLWDYADNVDTLNFLLNLGKN